MIFITLVKEEEDERFSRTKDACMQLFRRDSNYWVIENGQIKVHCKYVKDVVRFTQWLEEMHKEIETERMKDPEYADLVNITNRLNNRG
jgi:hypothetical protein